MLLKFVYAVYSARCMLKMCVKMLYIVEMCVCCRNVCENVCTLLKCVYVVELCACCSIVCMLYTVHVVCCNVCANFCALLKCVYVLEMYVKMFVRC